MVKVVSLAAVVWSRHATRSLGEIARCMTRPMNSCEEELKELQNILISFRSHFESLLESFWKVTGRYKMIETIRTTGSLQSPSMSNFRKQMFSNLDAAI